jgi:hypothetical protein
MVALSREYAFGAVCPTRELFVRQESEVGLAQLANALGDFARESGQ